MLVAMCIIVLHQACRDFVAMYQIVLCLIARGLGAINLIASYLSGLDPMALSLNISC